MTRAKKPVKPASPHGPGKRGKPPRSRTPTEKPASKATGSTEADRTGSTEASTASIETPMGTVARCQAKNRAGGQCSRPARRGVRVCSMHGAGTRKREHEGTRQNPRTAPITHGLTAQPDTLEEWGGLEGSYKERVESYRRDKAALRNLDELLARVWAVADIMGEKRPEASWSLEGGESAPPLLDVLKILAASLEKVARIEWKIRQSSAPTLTIVQAKRLVRGVVELLHEFVPSESLDECVRRLRRLAEQLALSGDRGSAPDRQQADGSAP